MLEVLSIVLVSFSCFLLFSLLSDSQWLQAAEKVGFEGASRIKPVLFTFHGTPEEIQQRNMMGPVGGATGAFLTSLFGFSSALFPFFILMLTAHLWLGRGEGESPKSDRSLLSRFHLLALWTGITCCVSGLLSLGISAGVGGEVGDMVASSLRGLFGFLGAFLLLGTTGLAVTYFLLREQLFSFVLLVIRMVSALPYLLFKGGAVILSALVVGGQFCWSLIGYGARYAGRLSGILWRATRNQIQNWVEAREQRKNQSLAAPLEVVPEMAKAVSPPKEPVRPLVRQEESKIVVVDHSKVEPSKADVPRRVLSPVRNGAIRNGTGQAAKSTQEDPYADFEFPETSLLSQPKERKQRYGEKDLLEKSEKIREKLLDFNVAGKITHVHPGPVITMYEFEPAAGVKVGKITSLQDDLAMALRAPSVRIIAPLPERGSVGIEVPNETQETVYLRDLLEYGDASSQVSRLPIPLGKDTFGAPVTGYIADMPHLLLAGATGTGKSVSINAILISLLYRLHPSELQLILIDPKILELSVYEGIPHLKVPVVTDPRKAKAVLQWAVQEMDDRYRALKRYGVRSIDSYNDLAAGNTPPELQAKREPDQRIIVEQLEKYPKILIVIDELADLMLTAGREIEELITRLAQKARAAGIHLLLATQRPSVDVITGLIKANFPARVSFRVSSRVDSRTILDSMGAERLLGKGDMLFLRPGAHSLQRVHGAFVSDQEVRKVSSFLRETCRPSYDAQVMEMCEKALEDSGSSLEPGEADTSDPLYDKAVQFVLERGQASTSMVQRAFRIGYNRAARIVDTMEQEGLVGPMDGSKPRPVLVPQASNDE